MTTNHPSEDDRSGRGGPLQKPRIGSPSLLRRPRKTCRQHPTLLSTMLCRLTTPSSVMRLTVSRKTTDCPCLLLIPPGHRHLEYLLRCRLPRQRMAASFAHPILPFSISSLAGEARRQTPSRTSRDCRYHLQLLRMAIAQTCPVTRKVLRLERYVHTAEKNMRISCLPSRGLVLSVETH